MQKKWNHFIKKPGIYKTYIFQTKSVNIEYRFTNFLVRKKLLKQFKNKNNLIMVFKYLVSLIRQKYILI
jgi:hypothetical protein